MESKSNLFKRRQNQLMDRVQRKNEMIYQNQMSEYTKNKDELQKDLKTLQNLDDTKSIFFNQNFQPVPFLSAPILKQTRLERCRRRY